MHYFFIHDKLTKNLLNRSERVSKSKLTIVNLYSQLFYNIECTNVFKRAHFELLTG